MDAVSQESSALCLYRLSLVLPAWNEEAVIAQAVEEATAALAQVTAEFEVIVVDDGSTDRTAEIVASLAAEDRRVRLVRQPANLGYGAALRAGFAAARHELVAFTDADCQFELGDLAYMLPLTQQYDIVSGYRIDRKDPPLRRFCSWGYNTLIQGLLGSTVRDVDCALKIFHRNQLPSLEPQADHYFANTEMSTNARLQGLSIVEVGVQHRPRAAGVSKVSLLEVPKTLSSLLPFWWQTMMFPNGATSPGQARDIQGPNRTTASVAAPRRSKTAARPDDGGGWTRKQFWAAFLLLLVVAGSLLFPSLSYPLIEPDEGRYAEIPREMLATGDWIVPLFHGEPYLDKPPLFYWLCATSYKVFGLHDWAARLVPALAAWLTVVATYWFGARFLGRQAAFLGSMMLALSIGFVCCGRFLILDSLLALLVSGSLFTALAAVSHGRFRWGWWLVSAGLCGLGVLAKGPVSLALVAPPVVAYAWLNRHPRAPRLLQWSAYLAVIAAITIPWYVGMTLRMPGFVQYFFWEHNVNRFLSGSNHPEPFWYYAPVLLLSCMPWGLLLFPLGKYLASRSPQIRARRTPEVGFLVLWAGWCLLFFSASRGKLPTYLLPCLPAIMLLLGHYVHETCSPFAGNVLVRVRSHMVFHRGVLYLGAAGILFAGTLFLLGLDGRIETLVHGLFWAGLLVAAVALQRRIPPQGVYAVFCVAAFAVVSKLTLDAFPTWASQRSLFGGTQRTATVLRDICSEHPIACVAGDWGSVPFYLNRDDVTLFPDVHNGEIRGFLERPGVSILVINHAIDVNGELLQSHVPDDAQVQELTATPKATVLAIRHDEGGATGIQQISAESPAPVSGKPADLTHFAHATGRTMSQ